MPRDIKIGTFVLGPGEPPLVIAEMSGNHNGSLDRALAIVDAAAEAGAHALKLQTYTADTMTLDFGARVPHRRSEQPVGRAIRSTSSTSRPIRPGNGTSRSSTGPRAGLIGFSSPFDETAVDFLEALTCPATRSLRSRTSTCR